MIDLRTAPYGIFLLRLTMGILFLAHCAVKIFVFTIPGTVAYFISIGLPGETAYFIILLELIGGLALIFGIYARYFALILFFQMLGVIYFVHWANGWMFTNPGGGWEYPGLWAIGLLSLYLLGDGAFALTHHRKAKKAKFDIVQESSEESFPASDAPPWTLGNNDKK